MASLAGICDNRSMCQNRKDCNRKSRREKSSLQIRPATDADVPLVLAFIRKLAEYGDIADEVFATEQDVREALCGSRPVAEAILAFAGGEPVASPLYSYSFSSFLGRPGMFIEDLSVETPHRGGESARLCWFTWPRWRGSAPAEGSNGGVSINSNERAMEFYQDLGAVPMEEIDHFPFGRRGFGAAGVAREKLNQP